MSICFSRQQDLRLDNVRVYTTEPDLRHAIVLDDVEAVVVDSLDAAFAPDAAPMRKMANARQVAVRNCCPPEGTDVFLDLQGAQT